MNLPATWAETFQKETKNLKALKTFNELKLKFLPKFEILQRNRLRLADGSKRLIYALPENAPYCLHGLNNTYFFPFMVS